MRQLILEEWISLDGFAADRSGGLDFFPSTKKSRSADERQLELLQGVDTMLLGRKTYAMFSDYWPDKTSSDEIIADKLNSLRRVIVSNTLREAAWGGSGNSEIISGDAVDGVRKLKEEPGKDIILWGSISLSQSLMAAGLVDRLRLNICPAILGGGAGLFATADALETLKLVESRSYESGVVWCEYLVAGS